MNGPAIAVLLVVGYLLAFSLLAAAVSAAARRSFRATRRRNTHP